MNLKKHFIVFASALTLMPTATKLTAEPVVFFFSGQITERRAENSVFTEPDTDQFYGYFSYDTAATHISVTGYPLLSFSLDGNSLIFTNFTMPFGIPGISLTGSGRGFLDTMAISGIYPPAESDPYDDAGMTIWLIDPTGLAFTTNGLPVSLNLASFDVARLQGPTVYLRLPPSPSYDRGIITQLIQIPEPAAWVTLSLGLLAICHRNRRLAGERRGS